MGKNNLQYKYEEKTVQIFWKVVDKIFEIDTICLQKKKICCN